MADLDTKAFDAGRQHRGGNKRRLDHGLARGEDAPVNCRGLACCMSVSVTMKTGEMDTPSSPAQMHSGRRDVGAAHARDGDAAE